LKRIHIVMLAVLVADLAVAGCRGKPASTAGPRPVALAEALRPERFAAALRQLGGAHYHGTSKLAVGPASGAPTTVTTTTDVWLDGTGNYRVHEENDQDGGRDVVLHGRELAVALRYGKMIRRVAEEPEPTLLLEQAIGAPWSLFELAAPRARVSPAGDGDVGGRKALVFTLALGEGAAPAAAPLGEPLYGLRAWRQSAKLEALTGKVVADSATGALLTVDLEARFTGAGPNGPVAGTFDVHGVVTDIGTTPAIARPEAEELALRQRTVPEQRELLRGLGQARVPPTPPHRAPTENSHGPGPGKR
jgi:hypothetical protein